MLALEGYSNFRLLCLMCLTTIIVSNVLYVKRTVLVAVVFDRRLLCLMFGTHKYRVKFVRWKVIASYVTIDSFCVISVCRILIVSYVLE